MYGRNKKTKLPLQDPRDAQCPINVFVYNNVSRVNDGWSIHEKEKEKKKGLHSRRGPAARNFDPFC